MLALGGGRKCVAEELLLGKVGIIIQQRMDRASTAFIGVTLEVPVCAVCCGHQCNFPGCTDQWKLHHSKYMVGCPLLKLKALQMQQETVCLYLIVM